MRVETPYRHSGRHPPLIFVMLPRHPSLWRGRFIKLCLSLILLMIIVQCIYGFSVYDLNIFRYNMVQLYQSGLTALTARTLSPFALNLSTSTATVHTQLKVSTVKPLNETKRETLNATASSSSTVRFSTASTQPSTVLNASYSTSAPSKALNITPAAVSSKNSQLVMTGQSSSLPHCPVVPPVLVGPIKVWLDFPSFDKLKELYPFLEAGGHSKPKDCLSRHRVAIIIPYRDREQHFRGFLHNLHSLLTKQQLDYTIVIVNQLASETFNRAKLMNVGYVEALKLYDWQCFVFHDVDLYPEDDRNIYSCPEQPRHMSVAVDKFKYKLPYTDIFGGISALTKDQFTKINGFSNDYWGWGGEDDDVATRVKLNGYKISRYPANIARYKMVKHTHEKQNPVNKCRYKIMYKTKARWKKDGLSNLDYTLLHLDLNPLYVNITVSLNEAKNRAILKKEGLC